MTRPITKHHVTCPVCGRSFAMDAVIWSEQSGHPLCPECRAEEESCGCSDD